MFANSSRTFADYKRIEIIFSYFWLLYEQFLNYRFSGENEKYIFAALFIGNFSQLNDWFLNMKNRKYAALLIGYAFDPVEDFQSIK